MKKLAIITTHPIQYNAPFFRLLAARSKLSVKVFYTFSQSASLEIQDRGFDRAVKWNIPLLEGYDYTFVENVSTRPGTHHFRGIDNPRLVAEVSQWQPDVVMVYGWAFKSHLQVLRYFQGKCPVIFRGDSTLIDSANGLKSILRKIFITWVYRNVDLALYVGMKNREYFKEMGLSEAQLFFAPHAVDNDRFAHTKAIVEETANLRNKLGIDPTHFVVLFAGKFEEKKAPFAMLQLSQMLPDPSFRFVMVGDGPLFSRMSELCEHDPRFLMMGFQNQAEMPMFYAMADVCVVPSIGPGETWGLVINEAMAAGVPVVASDKCGGAHDLLTHGGGCMFPSQQLGVAASYIEKLRTNAGFHQNERELASQIIADYNFDRLADACESAVQRLTQTI